MKIVSGHKKSAFTLIEVVIVIAIIGIMAALVISAFSNAAHDTRRVVARQQQAAVQSAVNAWVAAEIDYNTTVAQARATYNGATDSMARLALVANFLDETTYEHLVESTTVNSKVESSALSKTQQYLSLPDWSGGSYPKVILATN